MVSVTFATACLPKDSNSFKSILTASILHIEIPASSLRSWEKEEKSFLHYVVVELRTTREVKLMLPRQNCTSEDLYWCISDCMEHSLLSYIE